MSDAADRLAQSRRAIVDQIQHRGQGSNAPRGGNDSERQSAGENRHARWRGRGGWWGSIRHAAGTWWRHHPAHLGLELATPVLSAYAERKPLQYLGVAAALGAVIVIVRPWRLMSMTGLAVALIKSSQLSSVLMSALSAADFQKDQRTPYE